MKSLLLLLPLVTFFFNSQAQQPLPQDTVKAATDTSIVAKTDTSVAVKADSVSKKKSNGLSAEVKYSADDSIRFDRQHNVVYLYGNGHISYEKFELIADFIRLDQKNNNLFAKGVINKNGRYSGRPIFTQEGEDPVTTDSLTFNFKTKKGKTFGTSSSVEGGYIQASQSKKNQYDEVSIKDAIYSTCDLPHPHYGIHITKGIVTKKNIVTGPAYLMIEDVPFPIGVPFGFFPKANKRASGILFPTFGEEAQRGFFMRDMGYYIGLNDYWDAELRGSLYSKGSYEGSLNARYRKNYKYDGNLSFRYASTKIGIEGTPEFKHPRKDFNLQWSHSQRQEANPGTTFSASVNFGTSSYFSNTGAGGTYDIDQLTQNSMNSSISYGRTFADGRVNFTSSMRHSQDLTQGTVDLTLPDFTLAVSSFNPFDSKNRTGEQKWYQRINVGYTLQGTNSLRTQDSLLFRKETLKQFSNGFEHSIPVSMSLNVLKYFQFSTNVNYNEWWYFQTFRQQKDNVSGRILRDTISGFSRTSRYSTGASLSTKLYGILPFKKGKFSAIRHVMTPSVNFSFSPDFSGSAFNNYKNLLDTAGNPVLDYAGNPTRYSIYEGTVFGGPGAGRSASIGFNIDNTIEAKLRSQSDTSSNASQNVPILQGLNFSGSYNFAADSLNLSQISFSGRTSLFKQKLGINFGGIFDPYMVGPSGNNVINQFELSHGKLARLTNFRLSFDFSLNSSTFNKDKSDSNTGSGQSLQNATPEQKERLNAISRNPNAFVDFNIPWSITASYSFNYSKPYLVPNVTNALNFSGDFSVTPKWKIQYNSGYDFKRSQFTMTQFSIYRDLHCWDLSFNVVPFGAYRSYSVDLRVRASILQDLKLSKRRSYYDNSYY